MMKVDLEDRRFDSLSHSTLRQLHELTIDASRGDVYDHGPGAPGSHSVFKRALDHRLCGEPFPNTTVILARAHARYVGWSMITRYDIDPYTGHALYIPHAGLGFYVHPNCRRHGIGKSLIQRSLEVARSAGISRLEAIPWNRAGNSFFRSMGFSTASCPLSRSPLAVALDLGTTPSGHQLDMTGT